MNNDREVLTKTPTDDLSEIYSKRLLTKKRVYYIDGRESTNPRNGGGRYITVTESRRTNQGFQRSRIFVEIEDIDEFISNVQEVATKIRD